MTTAIRYFGLPCLACFALAGGSLAFIKTVDGCTPKTQADAVQLTDCVASDIERGVTDPVQVAKDCQTDEVQLVSDEIATLEKHGMRPPAADGGLK